MFIASSLCLTGSSLYSEASCVCVGGGGGGGRAGCKCICDSGYCVGVSECMYVCGYGCVFLKIFSNKYRIDHSYEEYMSPYILPVCGCPKARPRGGNRKCGGYTGSYTPSIRGLSDLYHGYACTWGYKMYNYRTGSICFYIYSKLSTNQINLQRCNVV